MKDTDPTRRGLDLLCQLIDIDAAISRLGPLEYQAVLLCGLLGIPEELVANDLGVHRTTMERRYQRALEVLTAELNGEGPDSSV